MIFPHGIVFPPDEITSMYTSLLTDDPSEENIEFTIRELYKILPNPQSVHATLTLMGMALDPIHPGLAARLVEGFER